MTPAVCILSPAFSLSSCFRLLCVFWFSTQSYSKAACVRAAQPRFREQERLDRRPPRRSSYPDLHLPLSLHPIQFTLSSQSMRTRRSLGDDPPATASASKPKAEATTAAQRRSSDRRTRTAPRQADPSSLADNASANGQGGAARESSEVEMNGHDHPDEPSGGDGEAAARSEVTSEIKGTTQLRSTSLPPRLIGLLVLPAWFKPS